MAIRYVVPQARVNWRGESAYFTGEQVVLLNCQIRDDLVPHLCDFFVFGEEINFFPFDVDGEGSFFFGF